MPDPTWAFYIWPKCSTYYSQCGLTCAKEVFLIGQRSGLSLRQEQPWPCQLFAGFIVLVTMGDKGIGSWLQPWKKSKCCLLCKHKINLRNRGRFLNSSEVVVIAEWLWFHVRTSLGGREQFQYDCLTGGSLVLRSRGKFAMRTQIFAGWLTRSWLKLSFE